MGGIYSILNKSTDVEVNKFLKTVTKRMDIDNCKTMINTYVQGVRFTTETLIQHCKDNNIAYFTRGEYDIFTLEEIEFINQVLENGTYQDAYNKYKEEYPKRHTDLTLQQFENKLNKIKEKEKEKSKGEEREQIMRYTNDIVEYVQNLGKEHTIAESLELIQKKYPNLEMDMIKLEDMRERYLIRFITDDNKFFTQEQVDTILKLGKVCKSLKETYNIFIGSYPNKCTFTQFVIEISKLKTLAIFNLKNKNNDFTPLEDAYIVELSDINKDTLALYTDFNMVFPNRCSFVQFSTRLEELKVEKTTGKPKVQDKTNTERVLEVATLRKDGKKKARTSILDTIYNDVVVTIEGNTIPDALEELKQKHPDIADKLTYSMLSMYAKRRNLNYKKDTSRSGNRKATNKSNISKPEKSKGRDGLADKIYEYLKEIHNDYTQAECLDLVNKKFGISYKGSYISNLVGRKGKLEFKKYEEFTEEMKKAIKELQGSINNKHDLYCEFSKLFKGTFKAAQFFGLLDKLETEIKEIIVHSTADTTKPQVEIIPVGVVKEDNEIKPDVKVVWHEDSTDIRTNTETNFVESIQQNVESPYQPIIDEVNSVFERKCKQLGVEADTTAYTDELISALETIVRFAQHKKDLVARANDHIDILEEYRREVEHEIEIQPWSETDTYCQNKIKAIALKRRGIKYFKDDISRMDLLLDNVLSNMVTYTKTIESLKHIKRERDNAKYVPRVDTRMVDKYDWCTAGTLNSVRANTPILQTNARLEKARQKRRDTMSNTTVDPNINPKSRISKYRVQAEFMVLDGQVFAKPYHDVFSTSEEKAIEASKTYFDNLSKKKGNAKYTILGATKLNVVVNDVNIGG